ncbi:ribonuclease H-like protein, partial [Trametes maxima]
LHIVSDSKYAVNGITKNYKKWEEKGWIGVANAEPFKNAIATLRARSAQTTLRWVKGHEGTRGNEEADKLAAEGAAKPRSVAAATPPTKRLIPGAALTEITQKVAYKGIREWNGEQRRERSTEIVEKIRNEVEMLTGIKHKEGTVWKAIRKEPTQRKIRDFHWIAMHQAHKVGDYWKHIPGFEHRRECKRCNVTETMTHILTECHAKGQKEIWEMTRKTLDERGIKLPEISLGLALSGPLLTLEDAKGKPKKGLTRLAKILIAESTYLIWVLRCQRVIDWESTDRQEHSEREIKMRWKATMDKRYEMDIAMTNKRVAGNKAIHKALVKETWEGISARRNDDGNRQNRGSGVLVGSTVP